MLLLGLALKAQSPADKPYLTQPDPQIAASNFQVVNGRGEHSTIKIENLYLIHFPGHRHVAAQYGDGYMNVAIADNTGACYEIEANPFRDKFLDGKITPRACLKWPKKPGDPPPPPHPGMILVARSWGYDAWRDDRTGVTTVVDEWANGHPIAFKVNMIVVGMGAIRGPDTPGGEMSFSGELKGQSALVTISYNP